MEKFRLRNGLTVLLDKRKTDTVAIEVQVHVGSIYESPRVAGISHFLEHMLFEGTKHRSGLEIANEIERVGGEFNAATSNERTFYYVYISKKHFKKAVEILADMMLHSTFDQKALDKERKVILSEINMVNDNPDYYQWIFFLKNLFEKNKARNPVYGSKETVSKISRNDVVSFFKKFYVGKNMTISLAGNLPNNAKDIVKEHFGALPPGVASSINNVAELTAKKEVRARERRDVEHSYYILGFKTPSRVHKDSYTLDVLATLLGKGQSSRLFNEVRAKRGLAYHVGCQHEANKTFGYVAIFLNTKKEQLKEAKALVFEQLDLPGLHEKEVENAKLHIEGSFVVSNDENKDRADNNAFWALMGQTYEQYMIGINKVTLKEVKRVAKKYFSQKTTEIVLEK